MDFRSTRSTLCRPCLEARLPHFDKFRYCRIFHPRQQLFIIPFWWPEKEDGRCCCRQGRAGAVITGVPCLTRLGSLRLSVVWISNALMYSSLLVRITTMPPELELWPKIIPSLSCPSKCFVNKVRMLTGFVWVFFFLLVITELEIAWVSFIFEVWYVGKSFAVQRSWHTVCMININ